MNKDIRKITQGAMIVSLLGALFLIDRQTAGIFNYAFAWVVPLPLVMYTAIYGFKDALVPFVSSVFLAFIVGTPIMAVLALIYGSIGLAYGFGVHQQWESNKLYLTAFVGTSVVFFVTVVLFAAFFGYNIQTEIQTLLDAVSEVELIQGQNIDLRQVVTAAVMITYLTTAILEAFLIHTLSRILLKRFKIRVINSKTIENVRFPKWLGIILLIGLFVYPFTIALELSEAYQIIGLAVYGWIVILLGYEAIVFVIIMQRRFKKKILIWVILATLLLPTIMLDVLIVIGLLDILSDLRSRLLGVKDNAR
jgi:uncharacterized protein YybS (DUF2232 family)